MEPAESQPAPASPLEPGSTAPLQLPTRSDRAAGPHSPTAERDPEFDATVTARNLDLEIAPEAYLRLVANPFLGLLALLGWLLAVHWLVVRGGAGLLLPMAVILLLASLALIPGRFQYHCLDCGRTGRLGDWRRHVCRRVAERRLNAEPRRFLGPSPPVQVVLWLWVLMALVLVAHAYDWLPFQAAPPPEPSAPRPLERLKR